MSKMGDWVLDLQYDKINLSREEFIAKHGEMFAYIYDEQLDMVPQMYTHEPSEECFS